MSGWKVYLGVARGRFLILALGCVILAAVMAYPPEGIDLRWLLEVLLVALAGVSANAAVNALNEYCDFHSGLDLRTRRTPFSGGSGTLPACPQASHIALWGGIANLGVCVLLGGYFLLQHPESSGWLLMLGLAGILLIITYTPWLTRHPWLCLPAPGAGFGLLMLPASVIALGGQLTPQVWLVAVVVALFCNNLLLVNQMPDVEADRVVGRSTLPMLLGEHGALSVVLIQWSVAYLLVLACVLLEMLSPECLMLWLGVPLALWVWRGLRLYPAGSADSLAFMAGNVLLTLGAPLLLAVGIAAGS